MLFYEPDLRRIRAAVQKALAVQGPADIRCMTAFDAVRPRLCNDVARAEILQAMAKEAYADTALVSAIKAELASTCHSLH